MYTGKVCWPETILRAWLAQNSCGLCSPIIAVFLYIFRDNFFCFALPYSPYWRCSTRSSATKNFLPIWMFPQRTNFRWPYLSKVLWYHFKFHVLYVVLSFGISVHTPRFNCKKFTPNTCNSPSYIVESTNNGARGLKKCLGVRVCTRNTYCFCSVFRCSGMCPKHLQTSHKLETWHVLRT